MREHQRHRIGPGAALVDKVDGVVLHACTVLRQAIQPRFDRAPVEAVAPVRQQLRQESGIDAFARSLAGDGRREAGTRQARLQVGQVGLGNGDVKRFDMHGDRELGR